MHYVYYLFCGYESGNNIWEILSPSNRTSYYKYMEMLE